MDIATIVGLLIGFVAVLVGFTLEGGTMGALWSITAAFIVFGGTIGTTVVSLTIEELKNVPTLFRIAFKDRKFNTEAMIEQIVEIAIQARRESLLSLEEHMEKLDEPFLKRGLQLIIDRIDTDVLREVLENDIYYMQERHQKGIGIFTTAGGYAPTMGIIGTVLGLVIVLSRMESPEELAAAIAVAFLATFYGIASANLFWLPIGTKLKARSDAEVLYCNLMVEGLVAIQNRENPTFIKERLQSFLEQKEQDATVKVLRAEDDVA